MKILNIKRLIGCKDEFYHDLLHLDDWDMSFKIQQKIFSLRNYLDK